MRHQTLAAIVAMGFSAALVVGMPSATAAVPPFTTRSATSSNSTHLLKPWRSANGLIERNLAARYTGGFPQYRIPALAVTTNGTLVAAYDARPSMADLPSHIAIVVRRSTDGGKTWGPQEIVRRAPPPAGFGDSSLIVDRRTGRVFLFYAGAVNEGYIGSHTGNNPHDPDILQVDYSYSDDAGITWHARRITQKVKNPAWGGLFAASGEGIQLRQGPYAGRLIQQYVIRIHGRNYAASLYSDDDGKTWKMGRPIGPGMDENKSVGLVDGDVLLDVRARPKRLFALSTNGGESWSAPQPVSALTDPGDNGSIIRYAPDAPASDPESRWLLESNTNDPDIRRNLVVRMSCDDGKTWPIVRVVDPGSTAYSTLTMEPGKRIGLFYERDGYRYMTYTSFGLDWLHGVCAPLRAKAPSIIAGSSHTLAVVVTNETAAPLKAGELTLRAPIGWRVVPTAVPAIPAGKRTAVELHYTTATTRTGTVPLRLEYTSGGAHSFLALTATVRPDASARVTASLTVLPVLDHFVAGGPTGLLGDTAVYWTRVTNTGNAILRDVALHGNLRHLANCTRPSLAPGVSFMCIGGTHRISGADAQRGRYVPKLTATGVASNGTRARATVKGSPIVVPTKK